MHSEVRIADLIYRLPADWELHECTVIAFPDRRHTRFKGRFLPNFGNLREEIILLFKHISLYEKVKIFGSKKDLSQQKELDGGTGAHSRRNQERAEFPDSHRNGVNMDIRYGSPLVVNEITDRTTSEPGRIALMSKRDGGTANEKRGQQERQCISFDREYFREVIEEGDNRRLFLLPISFDSSAFVHDGSGTFILSTALLRMLPQSKAPAGMTKAVIQANMRKNMGAEEFVWIEQHADFTDRPLSSMVRFVRPGHVLISQPPEYDIACPWIDFYDVIYTTLRDYIDPFDNKYLKITLVEEAHPFRIDGSSTRRITRCGSERWPLLSYLTYIHVKDGILVPVFGDKDTDGRARATLQSAFGLKCSLVDSVRVNELPWWGSSLHSITQHIPFDPVAQRRKEEFARVVKGLRERYLLRFPPWGPLRMDTNRRLSARQTSERRQSESDRSSRWSENEDYTSEEDSLSGEEENETGGVELQTSQAEDVDDGEARSAREILDDEYDETLVP